MLKNLILAHVYAVLVIGTFLGLVPASLCLTFGLHRIPVDPVQEYALQALGSLLAAGGGILSYVCMMVFILHGDGTAFPSDPPKRFVATGPYRFVRNPMYVGNLVLACGVGLVFQSLTYLTYAACLAVLTHLYVVAYEEPRLRRRFGDSYDAYCKAVNRWLTPILST